MIAGGPYIPYSQEQQQQFNNTIAPPPANNAPGGTPNLAQTGQQLQQIGQQGLGGPQSLFGDYQNVIQNNLPNYQLGPEQQSQIQAQNSMFDQTMSPQSLFGDYQNAVFGAQPSIYQPAFGSEQQSQNLAQNDLYQPPTPPSGQAGRDALMQGAQGLDQPMSYQDMLDKGFISNDFGYGERLMREGIPGAPGLGQLPLPSTPDGSNPLVEISKPAFHYGDDGQRYDTMGRLLPPLPDYILGTPPSSSLQQYRPDGNGGYTSYNPQADRMQGPTPYQMPQAASPGHHARAGRDYLGAVSPDMLYPKAYNA
jgi:hypothetical protein